MDFFMFFDKFFTTNYDPLLYRYLLDFKSASDIDNSSFIEDLDGINAGMIKFSFENQKKSRPLSSLTKRDVYSVAIKVFEKSKKHQNMKREDYYSALKIIRKELPDIEINDGFITPDSKNKSKKSREKKYGLWKNFKNQNIFYLHGALHIYQENEKIKKYNLGKNSKHLSFINEILRQSERGLDFCVFEKESEDKIKKIKNNAYLSKCLGVLSGAMDTLVILGWSCSNNDCHLVEAIKKSSIRKICISFYECKDKNNFIESFKEERKELIFFRSNILPFFKKG